MNHIKKKSYEKMTYSGITPEKVFFNRRKFVGFLGAGMVSAAYPSLLRADAIGELAVTKHPKYTSTKDLVPSDEALVTTYNNFYEFSTDKGAVKDKVNKFVVKPWTVEIGGLVNNKMKLDAEEIFSMFSLEERVYRLRCVETWSAVVPWNGIPLSALIAKADPQPGAKFVKFVTFNRPSQAPGMRSSFGYDWPYQEGLRLDEAMNDLTFVVNGIYGKPLPKQNGAPVRLVVPWKYGFKSIKSIVKIDLVKNKPSTLWNKAAPHEYGFYANVNPNVDHPRWSQKHEKPLGNWFKKVPTLLFNGYEEEVASLYAGMDLKKFY